MRKKGKGKGKVKVKVKLRNVLRENGFVEGYKK
jgi:hypothetical protein